MRRSASSNLPHATILVGFAEALSAPEVVWSLVDAGFNVVAFARRGRASALRHSRHVKCYDICPPESSVEGALAELEALVASLSSNNEERPVLFPLDDTALWICNRLKLRQPWIVAGPSGRQAELALNKCVQAEMALDAGFRVPKSRLVRTAEDLRDFSKTQLFPIILKPAECVSVAGGRVQKGRKWICASTEELERAISEWQERVALLVQPFIRGTGEGIFGLAAGDGIRAWSAHRRLRMMNPQGSGSSACISQTVPDDLKCQIKDLIRKTGWRGLFMIELLRDESGQMWFVEINGRPWGSMALSRNQGLEYPAWHVMLALNEQSNAGATAAPSTSGVVCRNLGREIMNLLFVLKGPKSKALSNWPSFWHSAGQVLRVHRGEHFYNWRPDDAKVFWADCYYTIHGNLFKSRS